MKYSVALVGVAILALAFQLGCRPKGILSLEELYRGYTVVQGAHDEELVRAIDIATNYVLRSKRDTSQLHLETIMEDSVTYLLEFLPKRTAEDDFKIGDSVFTVSHRHGLIIKVKKSNHKIVAVIVG